MKYHLIALGWLGLSVSIYAAQTATQPLPTLTAGDVKPNIMFTIDDSGSMAWSHMPDTVGSWIYKVGYHNSLCNGVYYNPNTLYLAPKNADGSNMPNASYTAAWYDGYNTNTYGGPDDSRTYNLSNNFFAYDELTYSTGYWGPQQTAFYWTYGAAGAPSDAQCKVSLPQSTNTLTTGSWTKTKIPSDNSAASVAARQNFANWFSYYRTRMLMMKSSAGLAFSAMDSSYRIGFSRIGRLSGKNYKSSGFLNIDNFDGTQKSAWYNLLYSVSPGGGTPLKKALSAVGEIYSGMISDGVVDPIQYSCQQNFEILTTDGYWNANGDGVSVGNQDGSGIPRPMFDGAGQENNLADVAMNYFKNDLRTTGPYSTNNVPNSPAFPLATSGNAGRQMMRTYTLGLGMEGTLNYTPDYETNTDTAVNDFIGLKNGTKNWPTIIGDKLSTIDDLWHAAVNGGGKFFSAKDPNAVAASLQSALNDISGMMASVSAADVSNEFMTAADNKAYNSRYKTQEWTGDVLAKVVDTTSDTYLATDLWSAQALLAGRAASTRVIYSCTGTPCATLTNFDTSTYASNSAITAGVEYLKTANLLSPAQKTAINGTKLVNFLRGDQSNEPTTANPSLTETTALFRQRTKTLGAIIHGGNQYVKKSGKSYADAGFSTFSRANLTRKAMVYAPANDGMLHAFDAGTGAELWAFIPPSLLPKLWKQADRNFGSNFQYFVDGKPTIADVKIGSSWKTILVGGLRGGGGEYYAIDITNPESPAPLWSFQNSKLGQTYGFPVIGKIGTDWKVLLSSGYDNSDNKGYVFVLNAGTGALEKTFPTTCTATDGTCGISKIGVLMEEPDVDDTIKMAYAGDLAGNLWRFDVTQGEGNAILVAKTGATTLRQPISSAPLIIAMPEYKNSSGIAAHYVTFGTGRFLHQSDMTNRDQQTIYGLFIDPSLSSIDASFTTLSTSGSLINLDISSGVDPVTLTRAANTALDNNLATCTNSIKGWRANLPITMERIPNDPLLDGDTAIYTTVIPKADSCTPGGVSRTYNIPVYLSKKWLCSNPSAAKSIIIGSNIDDELSDDASRPPSVNTPKAPSGTLTNTGAFKAKKRPKIQGRRSSWTEIIR